MIHSPPWGGKVPNSFYVQVHLWGEDELTGPITVEVEAPLGKPPVFYRRDSPWTELFVRIKDQFS